MSKPSPSEVKGVILAGGEGSRLRPLTYYFQKTMIPVGSRQKPLLEFSVRLLAASLVRKIVFLVGYKAEQIKNYFGDGSRFGIKIEYVYDDERLKGTAGSLVAAERAGALGGARTLLVYYGDVLSNINLAGLLEQHRSGGYTATIALSSGYRLPVGVAKLEGHEITNFEEKPVLPVPVSIGILAIEYEAIQNALTLAEVRGSVDIMGDLIPHLVNQGKRVGAFVTDAFWYDVGSLERYERLDNGAVDSLDADLDRRLGL